MSVSRGVGGVIDALTCVGVMPCTVSASSPEPVPSTSLIFSRSFFACLICFWPWAAIGYAIIPNATARARVSIRRSTRMLDFSDQEHWHWALQV